MECQTIGVNAYDYGGNIGTLPDKPNIIRSEVRYEMCKSAAQLLTDPYIRFVAETINNEILSGKIDITKGKTKSKDATNEEKDMVERMVEQLGQPFLDQIWICGLVVVRFIKVTKRKRDDEKYPDRKAVVIVEGMGDWTRLQIVTNTNTGERSYVLMTRNNEGRYIEDPEDSYKVFDGFGRRPTYRGGVISILSSLVQIYLYQNQMEAFIRFAVENMAKPAIVTEPSLGALGGLNMNDVMAHAAGFAAHLSDGRAKEYEIHMNDAEMEAAVKQQRDLFGKYVDMMTDGKRNNDNDQTFGAIRPLPTGHKVARHLQSSIRGDVESSLKAYQKVVAAAFNIDSATLFSGDYGHGKSGQGAVERSEKFMMLAFNKNRRSLSRAFTSIYGRTIGWNTKRDIIKNIKVDDRDADPDLPRRKMDEQSITIKFMETPPMKFAELCEHMKCGLLQFKDYKKMAEALLGWELSGNGNPPAKFLEIMGTATGTGTSTSSNKSE